ncbi:terpenoid synthase [Ophiobolus disseminans]|uniref:Terpenoid synthase n=1 Tax=Ophiobolus disseminans TaxID=1469910 RepID=A0A6A6ZVN3_9PLEO|nr:terpenoid synthase [Ophiobolus disseminans]
MSEEEQRLRLSGAIPPIDDFWRYRLGSSAVPVCLAFNEFIWGGMNLPCEFHEDEDVKKIQRCTNTFVSGVNDILSLKKEIRRGAIDSLVPAYLYHGGDLDMAVAKVVEFLGAEIRGMDEAAASLFRRYEAVDAHMQKQVKDFVDGCKHHATGNLLWSFETGRYGVEWVDEKIVMAL